MVLRHGVFPYRNCGRSAMSCRQPFFVPQGHPTIARRFNAGMLAHGCQSQRDG
jgi:hypothetical protein